MSLLDALLLDAVRQANEIWLAKRSDNAIGSGTQQDPYDGGTSLDAPISGGVSFSDREFIISTAADHGYTQGQVIHLAGSVAPFNGDHPITQVRVSLCGLLPPPAC